MAFISGVYFADLKKGHPSATTGRDSLRHPHVTANLSPYRRQTEKRGETRSQSNHCIAPLHGRSRRPGIGGDHTEPSVSRQRKDHL